MNHSTEVPWLVRYGDDAPEGLAGYTGDVVQAPRATAMDSLQDMRRGGLRVGAVLVCLVHELVQIPITPGEGPWHWPPSRTLCHPRVTRCSTADGSEMGYRPCLGRFWLLPHDTSELLTDGAVLYDVLCTVRSRRRLGSAARRAGRRRIGPEPRQASGGLYEDWLA
ncbi:hypothetical protein GL263_26060 [Streptomyces durbertensis]|uniref:Uncharacterized protein n=1 Tax=Streptomyces durbertensis TaxID=2448886 RepID=A0ABR6EP16_9ACTN|nr:hypothetical protein [Streptomyces durbertensis]MBB1246983.1 hypothetical protein [Streptomyces durbertensis]